MRSEEEGFPLGLKWRWPRSFSMSGSSAVKELSMDSASNQGESGKLSRDREQEPSPGLPCSAEKSGLHFESKAEPLKKGHQAGE